MQFRVDAAAFTTTDPVSGTPNNLDPAGIVFYSGTQDPRATTTGYLSAKEVMSLDASMASKRRRFRLKKDDETGEWTIDDLTWQDIVDSEYRKTIADVKPGDIEIWEWENSSGGWFHPLHIHLVDFKILRRSGGSGRVQPYEQGPKDVAYVGEGETLHLIMRFGPETGRYMVHCHNLVHEDHDMMSQFRVGDDTPYNDPMNAAPAY